MTQEEYQKSPAARLAQLAERAEQWEEMTLVSANSKVIVRWQGDAREAGDIVQDALENEQRDKQNTNEGKQTMKDEFLRDSYAIAQRRIEQLEAWITAVITKPSMSREQRLEGLEIVEAMNPSQSVRVAVERICPTRTLEQGLQHEIER